MPLRKSERVELERRARLEALRALDWDRGLPRVYWDHPLPIALSAAVPLRILEYRRQGGPSGEDVERCRRFAHVLGEKGDILLYRGKKPGQTTEVFNGLADAIAVMSFCPGGVTIFGQHYDAGMGANERSGG